MTELKTIKEINEKFRKDNTPQEISGDEFNDVWEKTVRNEAIKWYKKLEQENELSVDVTRDANMRWIKLFFNLTEEDVRT